MVIPWHLVLLGWIAGCSEVKISDNLSRNTIMSIMGNRDITSPHENTSGGITNSNSNNNQRPTSMPASRDAITSPTSKNKKTKSSSSPFIIPETTRAPHGVLTTTLLTVMLCDRCIKNKAVFTLELEPGVKEVTSKLSRLTTTKMISIKRGLDSFLMLLDVEEPYWGMSPIKTRCIESSLPLPWTPSSRKKVYQLIIEFCEMDTSIDARGKRGITLIHISRYIQSYIHTYLCTYTWVLHS